MPNYENIRPYAEFSHEAAQHGGIDNYLDTLAMVNQKIGIDIEKGTEIPKGVLLAILSIVFWEGGKWVFRKFKEKQIKKNEQWLYLQNESEEIKELVKNTIET